MKSLSAISVAVAISVLGVPIHAQDAIFEEPPSYLTTPEEALVPAGAILRGDEIPYHWRARQLWEALEEVRSRYPDLWGGMLEEGGVRTGGAAEAAIVRHLDREAERSEVASREPSPGSARQRSLDEAARLAGAYRDLTADLEGAGFPESSFRAWVMRFTEGMVIQFLRDTNPYQDVAEETAAFELALEEAQ